MNQNERGFRWVGIGAAMPTLLFAWACGSGDTASNSAADAAVGSPDVAADADAQADGRSRESATAPDVAAAADADGAVASDGRSPEDRSLPVDAVTDATAPREHEEETSTDARTVDVSRADGDATASSDGTLAADGGICAALTTGPLPQGGDIVYPWPAGSQPACLSAPFCQVGCGGALIAGLLACDAVQGGFYWGQGSTYIRVVGRQAGACVYDIGSEVEGAITSQRCTTLLPVKPWKGLYAVGNSASAAAPNLSSGLDGCQQAASCNILPGGPQPCDGGASGPPMCPTNGVRGPC